jgi:hypothetical protein
MREEAMVKYLPSKNNFIIIGPWDQIRPIVSERRSVAAVSVVKEIRTRPGQALKRPPPGNGFGAGPIE